MNHLFLLVVITAAAGLAGAILTRPRAERRPPISNRTRSRSRWPLTAHATVVERFGRARRLRPSRPIPPEHVAQWCDAISRRLRAGDTLRIALEQQRPTHRGLDERTAPLRRALGHGTTMTQAIETCAAPDQRVRERHLDLLWSVVGATADFGGAAAAPIDRVGSTLRLRGADGQERAAQSAQARLSAHVLTVVPLGVLALLVLSDDGVRATVSSPIGTMVVAAGLALNLTGWLWMQRVVAGGAT